MVIPAPYVKHSVAVEGGGGVNCRTSREIPNSLTIFAHLTLVSDECKAGELGGLPFIEAVGAIKRYGVQQYPGEWL